VKKKYRGSTVVPWYRPTLDQGHVLTVRENIGIIAIPIIAVQMATGRVLNACAYR